MVLISFREHGKIYTILCKLETWFYCLGNLTTTNLDVNVFLDLQSFFFVMPALVGKIHRDHFVPSYCLLLSVVKTG